MIEHLQIKKNYLSEIKIRQSWFKYAVNKNVKNNKNNVNYLAKLQINLSFTKYCQ